MSAVTRSLLTDFGPIAVHESGAGDPLVLFHANPGSHLDFEAVLSQLAAGWRVFAVDWPGYGDSPPLADPRTASAILFADVAEHLVERLDLPPAVLIGNSVGGFAAARLAARRPERVRALVLADCGGFSPHNLLSAGFCRFKGSEFITRHIAGRFARHYLHVRNEWTKAIIARTEEGARMPSRAATDAALWRSFASPEHDLREEAKRITCPTLLVWGKRDPVLKLGEGRTAERLIPGARLVELDTGHETFAEDPAGFLAAVQPFLEEVRQNAHSHAASHS